MVRRVVITGAGLISPLGCNPEALWQALTQRHSGIRRLQSLPANAFPSPIGGECRDFTGEIEDYGPLEKTVMRSIKKGRKLMCREIEMGVAAAQHAMAHSGLEAGRFDPDRTGVVFGSDYIMTEPEEFLAGIQKCRDEQGKFRFERWGQYGIGQVEPLWLLKYLPNMPASHIAIYNDLRGPSNSITMREATSNLSIAEAFTTIRRDAADTMVAGSTGTRIHRLRTIHVSLQEQLASANGDGADACRPFDLDRTGMVVGEGAGAVILESLETALARDATIFAEIVGHASSTAVGRGRAADFRRALGNAMRCALRSAGLTSDQVDHVHAHGLSTTRCDSEEAQAIHDVFGDRQEPIPVVAAKSAMGNLGAGSGAVELIASVLALQHDRLFPILNYRTPDPDCPIRAVTEDHLPSGDCFVSVNVTPQGQASALAVRRFRD